MVRFLTVAAELRLDRGHVAVGEVGKYPVLASCGDDVEQGGRLDRVVSVDEECFGCQAAQEFKWTL